MVKTESSVRIYRELTFSEQSFVHPVTREVIGVSLELRGEVDSAAFRSAYRLLLAEFPVLAAHVQIVDDAPHFVVGDINDVVNRGFVYTTGSWDGYRQSPPEAVGQEQLSALHLTGEAGRYRFTLWASHAATDGSGIIAMTHRLFELYTRVTHGEDIPESIATDFPEQPHQVMADRGYTENVVDYDGRLADTVWHGSLPASSADVPDDDSDNACRVRLSPQRTKALRDIARTHEVSVNALVSAVIARAELAHCSPGSAVALLTPVDFRGRLTPPIPLRSVTALCGFSFVAVTADDAITLARIIGGQLRADIADGTVLRSAVSPMPNPATRAHGPAVLISNVGTFAEFILPDSLQASDFHSQIVRSSAGMRQYVQNWDGSDVAPVPLGSSYLISTFAGALSIEMRVLPGTLSAETCRHVVELIGQEINDLGAIDDLATVMSPA